MGPRASRKILFAVLLGLSSLFLVSPLRVRAQADRSRFEVSSQFGASLISNPDPVVTQFQFVGTALVFETRESYTTTGRVAAGIRYYITDREALDVSYAVSSNDIRVRVRNSFFPETDIDTIIDQRIGFLSFNYVRYLRQTEKIQPFLTLGVGGIYPDPETPKSPTFAFNFGGGVDIPLRGGWKFRAEVRNYLFDSVLLLDGTVSNLAPTVGIAYRF